MTYFETIDYLYNRLPVFHRIGESAYKPGLENTIRLMEELSNPHQKFRSIHVAGTNGKGSVSNMLAAILQESGYKVGLYTSPHLVDFGERIRINGKMIDQQYVIDFVDKHQMLCSVIEPSFFELTMAMAFSYFADNQVDVAIIEVGLGGRLDSTNVILPELSVITNIGFDHVGFLGNTLEKIASEKAGIMKENVPVVIGEVLSETRPIFVKKAMEMNAPFYLVEERIQLRKANSCSENCFVNDKTEIVYKSGLTGDYQVKNLATVLESVNQLRNLNYTIPVESLLSGIEHVCEITGLQGRWQTLQVQPRIICDTGHNADGIKWVANQLLKEKYSKLRIVIGMVNDKDVDSVLKLFPSNAIYYFTQAQIQRALSADVLKSQATKYNLEGDVFDSVEKAVKMAQSQASDEDLIFIGGSNFVVGEAIPLFPVSAQ